MPSESAEALNRNIESFCGELYLLREKYAIRDVYIVVATSYLAADGEEVDAMSSLGIGDPLRHEALLAYSLGHVQAERQETIAKLLAQGLKKAAHAA